MLGKAKAYFAEIPSPISYTGDFRNMKRFCIEYIYLANNNINIINNKNLCLGFSAPDR